MGLDRRRRAPDVGQERLTRTARGARPGSSPPAPGGPTAWCCSAAPTRAARRRRPGHGAAPVRHGRDARPGRPRRRLGSPAGDPSLRTGRSHFNTVLLPDGSIFSNGGGYGRENDSLYADPVYQAELLSPGAGAWISAGSEQDARTYHSTSVLLPDGRVASAGDDRDIASAISADHLAVANRTAQIWTPALPLPRRPPGGRLRPGQRALRRGLPRRGRGRPGGRRRAPSSSARPPSPTRSTWPSARSSWT